MKVVAILSAYDESASWLATVCAGAGRFCDALIYCDGGYMLFPGARPRSLPEQAEAVVQACEAADLECLVHRPNDIWRGNEVEKRNKTLDLARAIDADWVVVIDADMHLAKLNAPSVRTDLESTDLDVATMTILEGKDFLAIDGVARDAAVVDISHEWTSRMRLIYRVSPGLHYGPLHWQVENEDGRLWGPAVELLPAIDMGANLVLYHRSQDRTYMRQQAARGYYQTRDALKVEAA